MQGHQWTAWHGHVTQGNGHIGHHTIERGTHAEKPGLGLGCSGLRLLSLHLGLGSFELGLGAIKCALADVLLLKQLLLTFELFADRAQVSLRGFELGGAAHHVLLGCTGIDAQQFLPSTHLITGLDVQDHDGSSHLARQSRLAHRLDDCVKAQLLRTCCAGFGGHAFDPCCVICGPNGGRRQA